MDKGNLNILCSWATVTRKIPAHWEFAVALQFAVAYISVPQPVQGEHCLLPPLVQGLVS